MTLSAPLIGFSRRIGRFEHPIEQSRALAEAAQNFESNKAAIESVWPRTILSVPETLPELEWLYARDGSLSGKHIDGQWIGQVSVPAKAARKMLGQVIVSGSSAVLLAPTHAQQIRTVLDRMSVQQVLMVIIPGEYIAGTILSCADFSAEIRARRLWLACGPDWLEEITAILESQDGIAPASMMIRVPGLNAGAVERVLKPCEALLIRNTRTHSTQLGLVYSKPQSPKKPPKKVCVVSGPFKLWDDASHQLENAIASADVEAVIVDSSIPTQSSALKVARSADGCDAILTANVSRTDLPMVAPHNVPWITWVTNNRIPRHDPAATSDRLIVSEPTQVRLAIEAGWKESSILVGQEPIRTKTTSRNALPAIFADLEPIVMPRSIEEMSSQRLVWERIEHDVGRNPLCIGASPVEYIYRVAEQIGLARNGMPIDTIRSELLVPQFMRSLAKCLKAANVKFKIYGRGWDAIPEVATCWAGPIIDGDSLAKALTATSAILDVWPGDATHPARRSGRTMIRPWGKESATLLREIGRASMSTMKHSETPVFDVGRAMDSICLHTPE